MSNSSKKASASGEFRSLTTERKFVTKGRRVQVLPRLVIQGLWFLNAGFEPGARVTVLVGSGSITLKPSHNG